MVRVRAPRRSARAHPGLHQAVLELQPRSSLRAHCSMNNSARPERLSWRVLPRSHRGVLHPGSRRPRHLARYLFADDPHFARRVQPDTDSERPGGSSSAARPAPASLGRRPGREGCEIASERPCLSTTLAGAGLGFICPPCTAQCVATGGAARARLRIGRAHDDLAIGEPTTNRTDAWRLSRTHRLNTHAPLPCAAVPAGRLKRSADRIAPRALDTSPSFASRRTTSDSQRDGETRRTRHRCGAAGVRAASMRFTPPRSRTSDARLTGSNPVARPRYAPLALGPSISPIRRSLERSRASSTNAASLAIAIRCACTSRKRTPTAVPRRATSPMPAVRAVAFVRRQISRGAARRCRDRADAATARLRH